MSPPIVAAAVPAGRAERPAAVEPSERLADPALEARARAISSATPLPGVPERIDRRFRRRPRARHPRAAARAALPAGDTDAQAMQAIVARYGDFVLLKPPVETGDLPAVVRSARCCWRRPAPAWRSRCAAGTPRRTAATHHPEESASTRADAGRRTPDRCSLVVLGADHRRGAGGDRAAAAARRGAARPAARSYDRAVYRDQLQGTRPRRRARPDRRGRGAGRAAGDPAPLLATDAAAPDGTGEPHAPHPAVAVMLACSSPAAAPGSTCGSARPGCRTPASQRAWRPGRRGSGGAARHGADGRDAGGKAARQPERSRGLAALRAHDGEHRQLAGRRRGLAAGDRARRRRSRRHAGYGEMLVLSAEGMVTPAARDAFAAALKATPPTTVARYYLALADAQDGHGQRRSTPG